MKYAIEYCILAACWTTAVAKFDGEDIRRRGTLLRRGPGNKPAQRGQSPDPRRPPPNQPRQGQNIMRTFSGTSASSDFTSAKGNKNILDTTSSFVSATGRDRSPPTTLTPSTSRILDTGPTNWSSARGSARSMMDTQASFTSARGRSPPQQGRPITSNPQSAIPVAPRAGSPGKAPSPTGSASSSSLSFNPPSPRGSPRGYSARRDSLGLFTTGSSEGAKSSSALDNLTTRPISWNSPDRAKSLDRDSIPDIPRTRIVSPTMNPGRRSPSPPTNSLPRPPRSGETVQGRRERSNPSTSASSTSSLSISGFLSRSRSTSPIDRFGSVSSSSSSMESIQDLYGNPPGSRRTQAHVTPPEISSHKLSSGSPPTSPVPDPNRPPSSQKVPPTSSPGPQTPSPRMATSFMRPQKSILKTSQDSPPQAPRPAFKAQQAGSSVLRPQSPEPGATSQQPGTRAPRPRLQQAGSSVPRPQGPEPATRPPWARTPPPTEITPQSPQGSRSNSPQEQRPRASAPNQLPEIKTQASPPGTPPQDPRKSTPYKAGNKQVTVHSGNGKSAVVDVPPGQIARVTVPNPEERNKRAQIILADLPPGSKPLAAAIARQNNPGGFASNCALTAAGCLTVASGAHKGDGLQTGAGATMIAAGTLGMANSFGIDRKAVDYGKKCVGAACKKIQGMIAKTPSGEPPSPRTPPVQEGRRPALAEPPSPGSPQQQATRQGTFASSVDELPVRRR